MATSPSRAPPTTSWSSASRQRETRTCPGGRRPRSALRRPRRARCARRGASSGRGRRPPRHRARGAPSHRRLRNRGEAVAWQTGAYEIVASAGFFSPVLNEPCSMRLWDPNVITDCSSMQARRTSMALRSQMRKHPPASHLPRLRLCKRPAPPYQRGRRLCGRSISPKDGDPSVRCPSPRRTLRSRDASKSEGVFASRVAHNLLEYGRHVEQQGRSCAGGTCRCACSL